MNLAMKVFEQTRHWPSEERFNLTDQIRRSSRSVCTNLAEAWRKRRYKAAFIAKLSDSETEATPMLRRGVVRQQRNPQQATLVRLERETNPLARRTAAALPKAER